MSVDFMVATVAAKRIAENHSPRFCHVVMTRVEFEQALAAAYLAGLEKGEMLERVAQLEKKKVRRK